MRGMCPDCSCYRIARPASELLSNAMGSNDTAVLTAIGKIQDDEKELDAQEDMLRARLDQRGQSDWGMRPIMSPYCGLDEQAGVYHVAEIRNSGMQCEQFTTEARTLHDCSTCAHRATPSRSIEDVKQEQAYAAMSSGKAATGNSASMIENLWKEHLQSSANRRANEARDTYQRKGILPAEPNYLDYCRHLSRDGRFVVCVLQNPHAACAFWAPVAATPPARVPASPAAPSARPSPDLTESLPPLQPLVLPQAPPPVAAAANAPAAESPLDRLTREFVEAQSRGDHQQAAKLQMQIQVELQNQNARLEMQSNIAKMYHDISMGIINNMK
jgi:hypothetical protein